MYAIVSVGNKDLINWANLFWKAIMQYAQKKLSNSLEISFSNMNLFLKKLLYMNI